MRLERFIIKYGLLTLPLLGILIGHAYAYASYHGILESWQMIGQPGECIVQILGTRGYTSGRKILV